MNVLWISYGRFCNKCLHLKFHKCPLDAYVQIVSSTGYCEDISLKKNVLLTSYGRPNVRERRIQDAQWDACYFARDGPSDIRHMSSGFVGISGGRPNVRR